MRQQSIWIKRGFFLIIFLNIISLFFMYEMTKNRSFHRYSYAVVDMKKLVHKAASNFVNVYHKDQKDGNEEVFLEKKSLYLRQAALKVRESVENFAKEHQLIVFSKNSVIGAQLREVTDEILPLLS